MSPSLEWMDRGLCVTHPNADLWFPSAVGIKGRQQVEAAARVCAACPVAAQCREHKKHTGAAGGVWGGRGAPPKETSPSAGGPNRAPSPKPPVERKSCMVCDGEIRGQGRSRHCSKACAMKRKCADCGERVGDRQHRKCWTCRNRVATVGDSMRTGDVGNS